MFFLCFTRVNFCGRSGIVCLLLLHFLLVIVPVQLIAWKGLSPKRPIMCQVGH